MKFHASDQVAEITRRQRKADELNAEALKLLREASELSKELHESFGERFLIKGTPYKLRHAAIGMGAVGNMYWLGVDEQVRVVRPGE